MACINSPSSITVAGDLSAVIELEELANAEGVFARRLKVDTAWHSHHMASIADYYAEALESLESEYYSSDALMSVAFSSPVTGGRVTSAKAIARPKHWVDSLVQPVQFVSAFTDMVLGEPGTSTSNVDIVVEVGPHTALGGPIQQILTLPEFKDLQIPYYGCLVRKTNARDSIQALTASLVQAGYPVDLKAVNFPNGRGQSVKLLTELPSYPWNHQIRHWVEPRFNKALRERSHPPHDLLGSLVEGSNPETPSWRHTLRISESPWTRDHVIQSNILYPAAGYICLAIEAIRQLATMDQTTGAEEVSGYRLRDVDFLQALMIPDNSDGIEIQTTMRPVSEKDVSVRGWKHFEVWTVTADNRWTQHAKGLIAIDSEGPEAFEPTMDDSDITGYTKRVIPGDLFTNLRALGIAHGPMFQNMKSIVQSRSEMRSLVTMAVADISVPNDLPRDHVLNPVTLDSIITAPYSAVKGAAAHEPAAKVPRSVKSFWVSSKISHVAGHLFRADSLITRDDNQGMEADVSVSDEDDGCVMLEMKGFLYQSLGQNVSFQQNQPWEKELCSKVEWSLDISMSSPATIASIQKQLSWNTDNLEDNLTQDILRVCVYFIEQTVIALDPRDVDSMESKYTKHYAWMKDIMQQAASGQLHIGGSKWLSDSQPERQHRINRVATARVDGEMICRLGTQLAAIMRGEVTPLDVMTKDNLLSRFYSETPKLKRMGSQLSGLLQHLAHKNPRIRILEIGAGAGTMTRSALEAVGTAKSGGPNASSYHCTDISAASLEMARENLLPWSDLISFDVLDIERDPATQGFMNGTYDVVIASRVLYATESISRTLDNVQSLLKVGGTLILTEDVRSQVEVQFVSGLLPGWYSGEDCERKALKNSVLSTSMLDHDLRDAGFSGVDLELHDSDNTGASASVTIMSTLSIPVSQKPHVDPDDVVIITSKSGSPPPSWLKGLQDSIAAYKDIQGEEKKLPSVQDLESASATAAWYTDKICIFIGEIDEPILYDLDSASLEGIRIMSTSCKGLIWVTRGGAVDCERPELGLAPGFVRTLRTEYTGRKFLTLDLDPKGPLWSDAGACAIIRVLQSCFRDSENSSTMAGGPTEFEYAERDGIILVPRFYHDVARDQMISSDSPSSGAEEVISVELLYQPDRPLCLYPYSSAFGDDVYANDFHDSLTPSLIEVEPRAYGTTLHATDERVASLECAGIITRVGSEAGTQGYSVGDRVLCVLRQSSLPSRAIIEWTSAVHIPTDLSFHDAASIPVAFLTAYFSLMEIARLQHRQSVLIHAAAGDVGQAAIMISRHLGAEIFATVGSSEERDLIAQRYGIPANHIFDSRNASFGAAIFAATKNRGVDVVLNSLKGPLLQESFNLVAPLGSFIEIGRHDLERNNNLEMRPFARHVSFSAVDLSILLEHRGSEVHRCLREVVRLLEAKAISPVYPLSVFAMGGIAEVLGILKTGSHLGKVVMSVDPNDMVPVLRRKQVTKISPNSSYLIVGGNGGLGQSVAHWMVSRGAKNLILLSRNASRSETTAVLAQELREAGCSRVLLVSGDVAKEDDLARAIQTCAENRMPPIRGLIHAAFVLRVSTISLFERYL